MVGRRSVTVAVGAMGIAVAVLGAPAAGADPGVPIEPAPVPAEEVQVASAAPAEMAEGVSHLPSPESLPPGTTQAAPQHPRLEYLRDIWQAVRTEDVTMSDAILLFAQRPLSAVPPGMSPQQGPVGPVPTAPPAAEVPAPPVAPVP